MQQSLIINFKLGVVLSANSFHLYNSVRRRLTSKHLTKYRDSTPGIPRQARLPTTHSMKGNLQILDPSAIKKSTSASAIKNLSPMAMAGFNVKIAILSQPFGYILNRITASPWTLSLSLFTSIKIRNFFTLSKFHGAKKRREEWSRCLTLTAVERTFIF